MADSDISSIGLDGGQVLFVGQEFGLRRATEGEEGERVPTVIVRFTVGQFPEQGESKGWGIWVEYDTGARTFYQGAVVQHITVVAPLRLPT